MRAVPAIAWITVGLAFASLALGGLVHAAEASLACPDWPLCHGRALPPMRGGVALEHGHRLLAATLGMSTLVLAWRARKDAPAVSRLAWLVVALVVVQALLGALTVWVRLHPLVSTVHLAMAMALVALLVVVANRARGRDSRAFPVVSGSRPARRPVLVAAGLVYVQALLGAAVRHTGAAGACGTDWLRCHGMTWPAEPLAQLQMAHRLGAIAVAAAVLFAVVQVVRSRHDAASRALALAIALAVLAQIGLGLASVATALRVGVVTGHLALGALLWIGLFVLALRLGGEASAPGPGIRASVDRTQRPSGARVADFDTTAS